MNDTGRLLLTAFGLVFWTAAAGAVESIAALVDEFSTQMRQEARAVQDSRIHPRWIDDRRLWFARGPADAPRIFLLDAATDSLRELRTPAAFEEAVKAAAAAGPPWADVPLEQVGRLGEGEVLLAVGERRFVLEVDEASIRPAGEADLAAARSRLPRFVRSRFPTTFPPLYESASPDGQWFVHAGNHNLWLRSPDTEEPRALTRDGNVERTWEPFDYFLESAGPFGLSWSPAGDRLAAVRLDVSDVHRVPLLHWTEAHERIETVPLARTAEPIPRYELFVFDIPSGERRPIPDVAKPDHRIVPLAWRPDGSVLFLRRIHRANLSSEILAVDVQTGELRTIISAAGPFAASDYLGGPAHFEPLADTGAILVLSESEGTGRLYLYGYDGKLLRRLTDNELPIADVAAVDEDGGWIYYRKPRDAARPYHLGLYRVSIDGARRAELTPAPGRHEVLMSETAEFFVDTYSSVDSPPVVALRRADGTLVRELARGDAEGLETLGYSGAEELLIPTGSGDRDIYIQILKPHGFDPDRRYPVVETIYGGVQWDHVPHHHYGYWRVNRGTYYLIPRFLMMKGYVVVFVHAPGTPGRGRDYHRAVFGIWPQTVAENHAHAIRRAAAERPWMDLQRVGVWGNSWGGYLTQRALIAAPELYRAGVSMGPVSDLYDHLALAEMVLGSPAENRRNYELASNIKQAEHIRGRLLLMPQPLDVNATFSAGVKMLDAMIEAQRHVDFFTFPGVNHHTNCCGLRKELYAYAYVTRYFLEHLTPTAVPTILTRASSGFGGGPDGTSPHSWSPVKSTESRLDRW